VQQVGFALGPALAGLVANASGFAGNGGTAGVDTAAFWVPAACVAVAAVAGALGLRLATAAGVRRV
jgi:hypothetical protein